MTAAFVTPRCLAVLVAVLLGAAPTPARASTYCVERDPDVVAGHRVHDGIVRCVPGP